MKIIPAKKNAQRRRVDLAKTKRANATMLPSKKRVLLHANNVKSQVDHQEVAIHAKKNVQRKHAIPAKAKKTNAILLQSRNYAP